jgi:dimethylglycine dehydrogenase
VTIAIDTDGASALTHEAVYHEGKLVGRITSGGYAYTLVMMSASRCCRSS